MKPAEESYPAFLNRVHRADVERGRALHKPGHCTICDDHHRSAVAEHPQKENEHG